MRLRKWNKRTLIASIVLVAFALRMLPPPGFMPASGRPFLMEICWEGLPADLLAQAETPGADPMAMDSRGMDPMGMDPMPMGDSTSDPSPPQESHHSGSPSPGDHCVFGTTCSAGPIPHLPLPSGFASAHSLGAAAFASIAVEVRVVHLPQPRAPPAQPS